MTQKYLATWPESPKRVRKKILTHAKDTPRSHTKLLSSPSRDLASLGIKRSIFAHWVLSESGDFVCYFKTVFIAFYGKRLW